MNPYRVRSYKHLAFEQGKLATLRAIIEAFRELGRDSLPHTAQRIIEKMADDYDVVEDEVEGGL